MCFSKIQKQTPILEQSLEDLYKKIIFLNLLQKAKCMKLILWIQLCFWSDSVLQKRWRLFMSSRNYMREQNCAASESDYCQGGRKDFFSIKHSKFTDEDENFHHFPPQIIDLLANMSLIRFWKESTWTTVCYVVSDCNDCSSHWALTPTADEKGKW